MVRPDRCPDVGAGTCPRVLLRLRLLPGTPLVESAQIVCRLFYRRKIGSIGGDGDVVTPVGSDAVGHVATSARRDVGGGVPCLPTNVDVLNGMGNYDLGTRLSPHDLVLAVGPSQYELPFIGRT